MRKLVRKSILFIRALLASYLLCQMTSNDQIMKKLTLKTQKTISTTYFKSLCVVFLGLLTLSACSLMDYGSIPKPTDPKPDWGPTIKPDMQTVIEKLESYNTPPLETLPVAEARKAPSPADAVKALMRENNISAPVSNADTVGKDIPVQGGNIHLRIYTPKTGAGPFPVIVYYHGGGWVIAGLDTYEASARALSDKTGGIVVSVAYRQAPEYTFPTAHNDSYAAYQWVLTNADSFKGDPNKIAVAGESAGGNLAAAVSIMARDHGIKIPVHQLLVYPIAAYDFNSESYQKYAAAKPLNKPLMEWFFHNYLTNTAEGTNPLISLIDANLSGLPPTTIIGAEIDPLQSEGKTLSDKLETAGVAVGYKLYKGVTHEFFGMATVVDQAKSAQDYAVGELMKSFQ